VSTNKPVTLAEAKTILKLCIDNDVPVYEKTFLKPFDEKYPNYHWNGVFNEILQNNEKSYINDNEYMFVSFTEFCNYIKGQGKVIKAPFKIELKLNSEYNAIVTKYDITVGCQSFSHDIIQQLAELSKIAQSEK
jgi:hypothetical protein